MSGFIRTIEKRIMKRKGFMRQKFSVDVSKDGRPTITRFRKGEGPILNADSQPIGRRWPTIQQRSATV